MRFSLNENSKHSKELGKQWFGVASTAGQHRLTVGMSAVVQTAGGIFFPDQNWLVSLHSFLFSFLLFGE